MIEKGSMFKAWEATTEQQKKAHEMQAIYKAQETARQAIQEAMNRYIKKKTRARSVAKAEADPFAELEGWESLEQIQEAYGYGEITSDRRDKLTDLWEAREAAQRKGKKDGKYHDLVTDMLARAIHSVGIEYADEIAAYEEERRMRRILFRGKLKSGEWASGNLNVDSKGICIIRPGKNVVGKYGRVNPETVGQATGILDKLARDIFEGDILKIHHKTPLPVGLAVVKYDKKRSAFRAFPVDRPWYACQIAYPDEIVGNIYDDPDLLKQGEDTQK